MKYTKTLRRRRRRKNKSRKNIAQRKKRSRKQKKRTTMKGGRENNIAERVIDIIDRVKVILDKMEEREDKLKDAELKDAELKAKATSGTALKDDPKYEKYFKMLSMHLPRGAVEQKMIADGLDTAILDLDPDQPAPTNSMEVSGEPVANPSRQGVKFNLNAIKDGRNLLTSASGRNVTHKNQPPSPKPSSGISPADIIKQHTAMKTGKLKKNKRKPTSAPLAPRPMSIVDNLQRELKHTLNGKRREYNNAAPEIPRVEHEKKPTISKVVIEKGNKFHIIGVNSSDGTITNHTGVVQNIDEKKYDVEIMGSDTLLDDILLENQLKEILEIDDIVIFQDKNSSIKFGKVDRVDRPTKTIRVQIDDKKTAWLSHDTRIKCDKDIKRGYKLMKKQDDIYYYGVPYNLLESCESLSHDKIDINEGKTFSFLLPSHEFKSSAPIFPRNIRHPWQVRGPGWKGASG